MLFCLQGLAQDTTSIEVTTPVRHYHKSTGIEIVFIEEADMFPESWHSDRVNAKVKALDKDEVARSVDIILDCFSHYPDSLLSAHVKRVYVLKSIEFFGQEYGGTYTKDFVFVTNQGLKKGYSDMYISKVFHAELSSVFFTRQKDQFPMQAWKKANSSDLNYGKGGMEALKAGQSSETFNEELHQMGVLNQYALSSLENDFNAFAKNLWVPSAEFWEVTSKFERLNKKLELIVDFYHTLDPTFDLTYFKNLTPETPQE